MRRESLFFLAILVLTAEQVLWAVGNSSTSVGYAVNVSPAGGVEPQVEWDREAGIATVIGRTYVWWHIEDERTGQVLLLELQADNAVLWRAKKEPATGSEADGYRDIIAVYVSGDVMMTVGPRTIRAEEVYYDLQTSKAIAVKAVMRNFDVSRGVPIYVRADKLKQLAHDKFAAEDVTLTTSEFYQPQISLNASNVIIIDTTPLDEQDGGISDSSYDAQMRDVRLKLYDETVLYWPFVRSNLQRPDMPLKGVRTGYDRIWGTSIETHWYLARLLGLQEPDGTQSTLTVDYYSERGLGCGAKIDYSGEDYFGRILGYGIDDHGEDWLGRHPSRRNLRPPRELRGRSKLQHRHFLPYDWQLTAEVSYLSDENFLEQYYRSEFNTAKEQETLVHLKRIEDNWGLSFLGKSRINNFANKLEELPGTEFHLTGQSLFGDRFTFYSDSQASRFRHRFGAGAVPVGPESYFTFASTRNELDMPMTFCRSRVVPFMAGTFGYEDGAGFQTDIDGSTIGSEDRIWIGEAGVRVSPQPFWRTYPDVKSRLWDLNQLRHIISPQLTAVLYGESDLVVEQRDTLNIGLSQRLQTKRGYGNKQRTVDWMQLDLEFTWVNNSGDASSGPDRFIWNKPFIPLVNQVSTMMPPLDRRSGGMFGPQRNYFGADFVWRLSDTVAILSDMNFDMQSGVVQQFNVGFSRMCWPNLSYYIGSRYLRRVTILDPITGRSLQEGSNAFTFAATYVIDPRYTLVFSQQFDFDYGANLRSDVTLIRKYHRLCFGITFSADGSLDRNAIVFGIWPEGVPELGVGLRRYMGLGGSEY